MVVLQKKQCLVEGFQYSAWNGVEKTAGGGFQLLTKTNCLFSQMKLTFMDLFDCFSYIKHISDKMVSIAVAGALTSYGLKLPERVFWKHTRCSASLEGVKLLYLYIYFYAPSLCMRTVMICSVCVYNFTSSCQGSLYHSIYE